MKLILPIVIATAIGLGTAWGGGQNGAGFGSVSVFLLCGILAFAVNWLAFIPASIKQTEKFYDLTGSLTYLTLMLVACILSGPLDLRSAIVAAMVTVWAARLGSFLFMRIHGDGKDDRFDVIKTKPLRFFLTWTLQGTWVILTAASALVIITNSQRLPIDGWAIAGFAIWAIGFAIEVTADNQKSAFKKDPANQGKFIQQGIWAWSRHPNYFGEIMLWSGITIASVPLLSGWQWVTLISPIFVIFLLTKVSGVPMLEKKAEKKWGEDTDYIRYRDNTPVLIPRRPQ